MQKLTKNSNNFRFIFQILKLRTLRLKIISFSISIKQIFVIEALQKLKFSVIFGMCMDGSLLRSMVVFKNVAKAPDHDSKYNADFEIRGKKSTTMDAGLMLDYIKTIILPYCVNNRALLVIDGLKDYISQEVNKTLQTNNISLIFLPPETTSYLDPLDVGIKSLFNDTLKESWSDLMKSGNSQLNKSNSLNIYIFSINQSKFYIFKISIKRKHYMTRFFPGFTKQRTN